MQWCHSDLMLWYHSDSMQWCHSDSVQWYHTDSLHWCHSEGHWGSVLTGTGRHCWTWCGRGSSTSCTSTYRVFVTVNPTNWVTLTADHTMWVHPAPQYSVCVCEPHKLGHIDCRPHYVSTPCTSTHSICDCETGHIDCRPHYVSTPCSCISTQHLCLWNWSHWLRTTLSVHPAPDHNVTVKLVSEPELCVCETGYIGCRPNYVSTSCTSAVSVSVTPQYWVTFTADHAMQVHPTPQHTVCLWVPQAWSQWLDCSMWVHPTPQCHVGTPNTSVYCVCDCEPTILSHVDRRLHCVCTLYTSAMWVWLRSPTNWVALTVTALCEYILQLC